MIFDRKVLYIVNICRTDEKRTLYLLKFDFLVKALIGGSTCNNSKFPLIVIFYMGI